jgi:phage-related protein
MRPVRFLGDSLKCLRDFPEGARHDAGYQLDKVQRGGQPDDFKPMPSIGKGVEEIRVLDWSGACDLGNCQEAGYEQTRELRECLGCDRGHP